MKRKELVDTLELLKPALATENMVPVFQCYMFSEGTVTATNDQIAVIGACDVEDTFAVDGKTLLGLLQNSKAEDVSFNLEKQDVHIKAGRSTFKLPYQPKENFLFSAPKMKQGTALSAKLVEGLNACLITSSKDNTQPALMGVCLSGSDTLYSCDGDAVTRYKVGQMAKDPISPMMPNGFCEAVVSICKAIDSSKGVFAIDEEWAKVEVGTYCLYGRIIKVDKPLDYEDLIKKTLKGKKPVFVEVPAALEPALARARVIADPESAKTVLTVEDGRLKLHTETHMGVVRDSMKWPEDPVTANVNAELVQRAIGLCDQMAILPNCTVYRKDQHLYQLLSNMG